MSVQLPNPDVYGVEIPKRPPKTWPQLLHGVLFLLVFNLGCVMVNAFQLVFMLPLKVLAMAIPRGLLGWRECVEGIYEDGIRYTKGSFGALITLACQVFAPTTLRVTFETSGAGAFTPEEIEQIIVRDASTGNVVQLRLPKKLVLIANHQIYADWWYVWCLTYFMDMHRDVLIVLKKSLKWVPVVGWGMQIFRFIFLARSWASDRLYLAATLAKLGRKAQRREDPFALIIYPEGTLVSVETRPVSKKYADKMGFSDMRNTLLPRSTGLQYSLRSLSPRLPTLKLLDIAVAYPGIPHSGYGQSHYTLRSIFMDRVPPPVIHMHLRLFDVSTTVPIGDLRHTHSNKLPPTSTSNSISPSSSSTSLSDGKTPPADAHVIEVDVPERERVRFDEWLRELWRAKDEKIDEFHAKGVFDSGARAIEIPVRLRRRREVLDAFCFFGPALVGYAWRRLSKNTC